MEIRFRAVRRQALRAGGLLAMAGMLLLSGDVPAASRSEAQNKQFRAAVDSAIERVRPALVRIHVVSTDYREGREIKSQSVGSGAIITRDGKLITNHHVAGHGARMICTLWNREEIEAELVGTDPLTDVAVLKLLPPKPRNFAFVKFGDSTKIRPGDPVIAMGSPMALSQSVTLGIISNVEMTMPRGFSRRMELDGEDVGSLVKWIGHDAAIYGGNSGGPLVNLAGDIIGVNEISYGLSGAIPGNLARAVAEELMAKGKVTRSWLGLDVQPLFKHTEGQHGVIVSGVVEDSPAALAGAKAGDLLLAIDGKETNARYEEQMPEVMATVMGLRIGRPTSMTMLRAGKRLKFTVTPIERGEVYLKEQELKEWGITARNISFLEAKELKRTNRNGVLITSVRPGGPSGDAKPSVTRDSVLVEVNGNPVNNLDDLKKVTEQVYKGKGQPVPVMAAFERDAKRTLSVVAVGIQEVRDPGMELSKAWLPVETAVLRREISTQLKMPDLKGFYVTQVYPGLSADRAGLKTGDMIVAVDGEKLTASAPEHEEELSALIRQYDIGTKVELSVIRGKEKLKVPVELERSPKLQREMKKYRSNDFEFTARDISFFDRAEEQWSPDQTGALVEEVKSGGWAELGSMSTGDLILEVEGESVKDVAQLKTIMDRIVEEQRKFVVMKVLRGIHNVFLEFEPSWKNEKGQ
jgi:serine protease Do